MTSQPYVFVDFFPFVTIFDMSSFNARFVKRLCRHCVVTKLRAIAAAGMLALAGCGIEPDSWYCKQNGYTPGTDLYLQCLNDHAASRLAASAILLQNGQREMQGQ